MREPGGRSQNRTPGGAEAAVVVGIGRRTVTAARTATAAVRPTERNAEARRAGRRPRPNRANAALPGSPPTRAPQTRPTTTRTGTLAVTNAAARKPATATAGVSKSARNSRRPPATRWRSMRDMPSRLGSRRGRFVQLRDGPAASEGRPAAGCHPHLTAVGRFTSRPAAGPDQPRLVRGDRRLHPVAYAELAEEDGDVVLHGGRTHPQDRRDLSVGQPPRDLQQHVRLARGEQVEPGPVERTGPGREPVDQPAGHRRIEQRGAPVDHPYRVDHPLRLGVLEQETGGPGAQRGEQVLVETEGGQHQNSGRGAAFGDRGGRREPADPRHADIHQRDVRPRRQREFDRRVAVRRLSDDAQVGFRVEDRRDPGPYDGLIVRDGHSDRHGKASGSHTRPAPRSVVERVPPAASARARSRRSTAGTAGAGPETSTPSASVRTVRVTPTARSAEAVRYAKTSTAAGSGRRAPTYRTTAP